MKISWWSIKIILFFISKVTPIYCTINHVTMQNLTFKQHRHSSLTMSCWLIQLLYCLTVIKLVVDICIGQMAGIKSIWPPYLTVPYRVTVINCGWKMCFPVFNSTTTLKPHLFSYKDSSKKAHAPFAPTPPPPKNKISQWYSSHLSRPNDWLCGTSFVLLSLRLAPRLSVGKYQKCDNDEAGPMAFTDYLTPALSGQSCLWVAGIYKVEFQVWINFVAMFVITYMYSRNGALF